MENEKQEQITVKIRRSTHEKIEAARAREIGRTRKPKLSFAEFIDELVERALKYE